MAETDELEPPLRELQRWIRGSFARPELVRFRALHTHSPRLVEVEGQRLAAPCAFPGCAHGLEAEALTLARRVLARKLIWRGGPYFEWQLVRRG